MDQWVTKLDILHLAPEIHIVMREPLPQIDFWLIHVYAHAQIDTQSKYKRPDHTY